MWPTNLNCITASLKECMHDVCYWSELVAILVFRWVRLLVIQRSKHVSWQYVCCVCLSSPHLQYNCFFFSLTTLYVCVCAVGKSKSHSRKSSQSGSSGNNGPPSKRMKSSTKDVLAEATKHGSYSEMALFDKVRWGGGRRGMVAKWVENLFPL